GKAGFDDPVALPGGLAGVATGLGGLLGVAGHPLDALFQLAEGVIYLGLAPGLALGAGVQRLAELGELAAAVAHLSGMSAQAVDQLGQVLAQAVQRLDRKSTRLNS